MAPDLRTFILDYITQPQRCAHEDIERLFPRPIVWTDDETDPNSVDFWFNWDV